MTGDCKISRVKQTKNGVPEKKTAKKQNLGCEKNPHAKLRRAALLREIIELLGNESARDVARRVHIARTARRSLRAPALHRRTPSNRSTCYTHGYTFLAARPAVAPCQRTVILQMLARLRSTSFSGE